MVSGADRALADRVDALTARLGEVLDHLERLGTNSNVQRVIVSNAGIGPWQVAAVCACIFTSLMLIIALIFVVPDIHDLRAWQNVFGRDLAALKAAQQERRP